MENSGSDEPRDNSHLIEHWKSTLELRNDQYTTFDKAILGVSGGALGLSIANADKLSGGATTFSQMLLLSWLAFACSIAANITSYWTSAQDTEKELRKISLAVEHGKEYSVGNAFRTTTIALNFLALALFCVGIIALSAHAYRNMEGKAHETPTATDSNTIDAGAARKTDTQPGPKSPLNDNNTTPAP